MFDQNPFAPRAVTCITHRREKATHICTDLNCQHNPILCPFCLSDLRIRTLHGHESNIRPLSEGVEWLTSLIRNQSKSIELIYQRTIGSRENEVIKFNLEKGSLVTQQMQNRLQSLKMQLELEIQMLVKEFQKQIQTQKVEYQRKLQDYHRNFMHNLDVIKKDSIELLTFQHSLKYYNNSNSFTLKLISETEHRSQQWIINQKRVLNRVGHILQNHSFLSTTINVFARANKSNIFTLPSWKADKRQKNQVQRDIRGLVRMTLANWMQIPQLIDIQIGKLNQYGSNKYHSYQISV